MMEFLRSVAKHAANGFKKCPKDVVQERMSICGGCDRNLYGWCGECHCYLAEKTTWQTEQCPLDKWAADYSGPDSETDPFGVNTIDKKGCCGS